MGLIVNPLMTSFCNINYYPESTSVVDISNMPTFFNKKGVDEFVGSATGNLFDSLRIIRIQNLCSRNVKLIRLKYNSISVI
jgi:hypothetical protein